MIDLNKFQALKKKSEEAKEKKSKAVGALEQQMKRLQEEFGCTSIEEAEALLQSLKLQEETAEAAYNEKLAEFEAKWGSLV